MKKLFVLAIVIFFSTTPAVAQPWGRGMGSGGDMRSGNEKSPYAASDLDLTEEQSAKLQKIHESYLGEITPLQNRLFTKRAEMRILWEDPNPDMEKILERQKEVHDIRSQIEEKATMYRLELQAILTPEQRARMIDWGSGGIRGRGPGGKIRGAW